MYKILVWYSFPQGGTALQLIEYGAKQQADYAFSAIQDTGCLGVTKLYPDTPATKEKTK